MADVEKILWKTTAVVAAAAVFAAAVTLLGYFGAGQPIDTYPESFDAQGASALLAGMLSASAAILAISFTLNYVVLSNVSQRYSSRLVESYTEQLAGVFAAFVSMVAFSAALLLALGLLPAWFAAPAVLALTVWFFAALWLFARGFIHMMRVVSPHNFKDAQEKILAEMVGSRGEDRRAQSLREKPSQDRMRALGDTAVKSLASNDDDVCVACVEALYGVAEAFLNKKRDRPKEYEVVSDAGDGLSRNAHALYAAREFVRILHASTGAGNSPVTQSVLEKFYKMTELAMRDGNNLNVIAELYDTARSKGSLYLQLLERVVDAGGKYDKIYAIKHLAGLPYLSVSRGRPMEFAEQFITYHVFRSVVIIIERGDFDLFKEVLRLFSSRVFFNGEGIQHRIKAGIRSRFRGSDPALLDRILFELDNGVKKDFGRIPALKKEIEDLAETRPSGGGSVSEDMDNLYACSLLWGTFFRIACYLIGKGGEYGAYLHELWNHTNPAGQPYRSANEPPCSKDVDWNSMYAIWHGFGGSGRLEIWDNPIMYAPHYRKYAALHMLREGEIWRVPTDEEIARWGQSGSEHALRHHYEIAYEMDAGAFLEALGSLSPKLLEQTLPGLDVTERFTSVSAKLNQFKDGRERLIEKLAGAMPLDGERTEMWKDMVRQAYSEHSRAESIARVKYDEQLRGAERVSEQDSAPRESLVKKSNMLPDDSLGEDGAGAELEKILDAVGNGAIRARTDPGKLADSIKACVRKIRDAGRSPSVALVSLDHRGQIPETYATDTIHAGGAPIRIIDAPIPPGTTFILDPDCVQVAYKAKDKAGRIRLEVKSAGTDQVTMDLSTFLSVKILDGGGAAKITFDA